MAQRFHRKQDEETTYWLSYSDMMAGLLLAFVLIISLTVLHSKVQYDLKQNELLGKEQELMLQTDALREEQETVRTQQALLDQAQAQLDLQASALADQEDKLLSQEEKLRQQNELLRELQKLMDSQQEKLDRIIGVRSELIEALKEEFDDSNLHISVDESTGAITFDSTILFEYNRDELKETGEAFLGEFFPRYVKILMGPEYREYVSEIIIEGHTDTSGNYMFNLDLSQKRAFSVAEYCLSDNNDILTKDETEALRSVVSTSGRSWSDPVYNPDGSVNMEASRRVEVLFRLKDEEMIREMIEILNSGQESEGQ
ncbi:MAG: OmpA family protein [Lachnospiraceae bacterium]|nr:OmpA family protein [Lachnospiraceae bacterium]